MARKDNVARMFEDPPALSDEVVLAPPKLSAARPAQGSGAPPAPESAIDLTGHPKVIMAIGTGGTGKTTLLRWICEKSFERDDGDELMLATVDPVNRELAQYFAGTVSPTTTDAAAWLERLLAKVVETKWSAAIDFGGGDTSLPKLVEDIPDLLAVMDQAAIAPVAVYLLSPRVDDLTPLSDMQEAGFQPKATALVLNEGRVDTSRDPAREFALLRRHPVYQTAIKNGAVEIWMPRLYAAQHVEARRITYRQAADGGGTPPLGVFDRSRVHRWLVAMDAAFTPIARWMP
jgi:GTPase SAR1 family protein